MRKAIWIMALCGLAFSPAAASAEMKGHEGHEGHDLEGMASTQTVTGEVVDLACYLDHGATGAGHKECGEKCAASGLPVGIKTAGALYLVIASDHTPANKTLAPLVSKEVVAEGEVTERDGVKLLALKKVTVK